MLRRKGKFFVVVFPLNFDFSFRFRLVPGAERKGAAEKSEQGKSGHLRPRVHAPFWIASFIFLFSFKTCYFVLNGRLFLTSNLFIRILLPTFPLIVKVFYEGAKFPWSVRGSAWINMPRFQFSFKCTITHFWFFCRFELVRKLLDQYCITVVLILILPPVCRTQFSGFRIRPHN
jgi:hypothetical protein